MEGFIALLVLLAYLTKKIMINFRKEKYYREIVVYLCLIGLGLFFWGAITLRKEVPTPLYFLEALIKLLTRTVHHLLFT
ncbi:hypothetical protein ABET11_18685 [Priestia megaterium]|uniref:hypothetical protein n=1 Tax=Priestia megaterium TaxID=1404 RepID=UPI000BFA7B78|nr:hypothetical protein [Priestia megaterium]MED4614435.1 hypothetical protein [Priestia megaterium]PEW15442.1 hypothetical protein CN435_19360 [Priestia megaterium]PEZ45333.1 hypothetical protein CN367_16485 [Priestia megaterium]PFL70658.1 hypothetical protein COJ36_03630 [Priestia megaterium]QCR26486.1 hypothetical protein C1N54_06390 [Priestia megaterium]